MRVTPPTLVRTIDMVAEPRQPNVLRYILKVASAVGLTAIICCVAPALLFLLGLVGGAFAISFADFFYQTDGSAGAGAWLLRGIAAIVAVAAIVLFWRKEQQCSIDPRRRKKNTLLVALAIPLLGLAIYLGLERASAWYFDRYIVPAQQRELSSLSTSPTDSGRRDDVVRERVERR